MGHSIDVSGLTKASDHFALHVLELSQDWQMRVNIVPESPPRLRGH